MSATDHAATLGELVLDRPRAAVVFERLRLDYCCGGRQTLAEACSRRGLDVHTVRVLLDALGDEPRDFALDQHDVARCTITELCDHIVARHHKPLWTDLPHISELLATVVRVHAKEHRDLLDVQRLFTLMRDELERHLDVEERTLFPACRALEQPGPAPAFGDELLALLEDDHDGTGDLLCALREVCGGYRSDRALCSTHRALMGSLHALELDLHQHVHEENNVLFPRVRRLLGQAA